VEMVLEEVVGALLLVEVDTKVEVEEVVEKKFVVVPK